MLQRYQVLLTEKLKRSRSLDEDFNFKILKVTGENIKKKKVLSFVDQLPSWWNFFQNLEL